MITYWKKGPELLPGLGMTTTYQEVNGEWITRQVEVYDDRWYMADSPEVHHPELGGGLCDRPLSDMISQGIFGPENQIEKSVFEEAWHEAVRRTTSVDALRKISDPAVVSI